MVVGYNVGVQRMIGRLVAVLGMLLVALVPVSTPPAAHAATLPPIGHVFIIILENKNYADTFGVDSPAPYLAKTLVSQGQLIRNYYAIGHLSLPNYIAMLSGQAPNPQTQSDCQFFTEFVGPPVLDPVNGQAVGDGCVYPANVKTIADQLTGKGLSWKGYMEDMGTPCRHPALNGRDDTQSAMATSQYAARHNPFVYFHSIIDSPACAANDVDLGQLTTDLASAATTPNFAFITPDLCSDGHDAVCADGRAGGYTGIDNFLKEWVPRITSSPAFKQDGLLLVGFDEAEADQNDPQHADASACCGEIPGPNSPLPGIFGLGGGKTGMMALSPWVQPGSVNDTPYNHYSLLRSLEDLFGVPHLGFAAASGLVPFGDDVFNGPGPAGVAGSGSGSTTGGGTSGAGGSVAGNNSSRGDLAATGGVHPWLAPGLGVLLLACAFAARRIAARR
jgi:hypothetical protein